MVGIAPQAHERERLIVEHIPLVHAIANRYSGRGEPVDDLVQAGMVGLIKAVDRFDPSFGVELTSFAAPTILGEIRRHFRDRTWIVRPPRAVQEARAAVNATIESFSAEHGRSPSVREIATALDLPVDEVLDALAAGGARHPETLSSPDESSGAAEVAIEDPSFERVEASATLSELLPAIGARERRILQLRFHDGLTQSQIGARMGISQMHVSRLLRRALADLRERSERQADDGP